MKILALPSRLTLALEHLLDLAVAEPRLARKRAAPSRHAALRAAVKPAAPRVPALHAALLSDVDLRMVARPLAARPAPRFGRAWAVRAGTGHRAVGRAIAPGLWL
jgi:hypothetical protein